MRITITKITKAYIRTYSDNGQTVAYVKWIDSKNGKGRTEGEPDNTHMQALLNRARREGLTVDHDTPATATNLKMASARPLTVTATTTNPRLR